MNETSASKSSNGANATTATSGTVAVQGFRDLPIRESVPASKNALHRQVLQIGLRSAGSAALNSRADIDRLSASQRREALRILV